MDKTRDDLAKLKDLIRDIRICMLTTVIDGALHSRPMATTDQEFDGDLWFFTQVDSTKVHELERDARVNLSYAQPGDNAFVSVTGTAQLVRDPEKIRALWNPLYKAWFPDGVDDPSIALLRVNVERAEFWDAPESAFVKVVGFVKATLTGTEYHPGENREVPLAH